MIKENQSIDSFTFHDGQPTSMVFSPINKMFLCSFGLDRKIIFYHVVCMEIPRPITTDYLLTSVSFDINGFNIAVGTVDGSVLIYDLRNNYEQRDKLSIHMCKVNFLEFAKITIKYTSSATTERKPILIQLSKK